jgi:tetratricopeptide (TPR) repeat protein
MNQPSALNALTTTQRKKNFVSRGGALLTMVLAVGAFAPHTALAAGTEDNPPTTVAGKGSTDPKPSDTKGTPETTKAGSPTTIQKATLQSAGERYESAKKHIANSEWAAAIADLEQADKLQPNNADVNNQLGHSHRKLGHFDLSLKYYQKALSINPNHKGANEYLGELYVQTDQLAKAKTQLAKLAKVCGNKTCEEYVDLKKAIDAYKPAKVAKKK